MEKLTSIRLQPMINIKKIELNLLCPILNFGRKKKDEFKFPIIFKDEKIASQLYDELELLIGKSFDEVRVSAESLYEKYKTFDYRANQKK